MQADRVFKLVSKLNVYRESYYNQNKNLVSDKEYDMLFDELAALEKSTGIIYANSPTQTVGFEVKSQLEKVEHDHKLLSLAKTTDVDEFNEYFKDKAAVLMAKMDGITCSLTYDNGELVKAETRGDGYIGENILHNAMVFSNLPKEIPYKHKLCVDGEAIVDYDTFNEINKRSEVKFKNPRNLASGSVRQLDSSVTASRNVKFIAWKLYSADSLDYSNSFVDNLMFLSDLGFKIVPISILGKYDGYAAGYIDSISSYMVCICKELSYPIDGIVGTFNDIGYGESLGETSHHPKHSFVYKFYQERNQTTLLSIEWNTTRTGLITPVAIFEPVEIDGTTVSHASLSNISIIKELELGIGDKINVIKANQIIPKVTDNLTRSGTYEIPDVCPVCGAKVIVKSENGRERLFCSNENCKAIIVDRISHFVSRGCMDIDGLSEETIKVLVGRRYINDVSDIYRLSNFKSELQNIPRFGEKKVDNLLASIEKSRNCKAENFIVAIGLPGIGKSVAKDIAIYLREKQSNLPVHELLCNLSCKNEDWSNIDGVGDKTSAGINIRVQENRELIAKIGAELTISYDKNPAKSRKLDGLSFCITGKLTLFANRKELEDAIVLSGGKINSSVSKNTTYLVSNGAESSSAKYKKAMDLGVKIISEKDVIDMLNNDGDSN